MTSPPIAPTLMAPENATNTRAAAVPMLKLTGWKFSTGRPRSKSGESKAMMHKITTMAMAPVTMGIWTFLMALTPVKFTKRMKASNTMAMAFALTFSMP